MLDKFKSILQNDFDNFQDKQLFLAISGGKDSICLSQLLLAAGFKQTLLHCNFQLRDPDANLDEDFVNNYAKRNNLPIHSKTFDTSEIAKENKLSIQETARNLRYEWFNTCLTEHSDILLTAHHSDDSIETFFINLMRGTSLKGLTGINNNNIARPLLAFSALEIEDYIKTNNIQYRQDQSNFNNKYLRNYLRNKLIPAIQEKSENFKPKVVKTLQSLKEADSWIQRQAANFQKANFQKTDEVITVNKSNVLKQDHFFLTYIFKTFGIQRSNVESFTNAMRQKTGALFVTPTYQFTVNRDQVLIAANKNALLSTNAIETSSNNKETHVETYHSINSFPHKAIVNNLELKFAAQSKHLSFSNNNNIQQFDLNQIALPLTIRPWQQGDRMQPLGMKGSKLISDILIDKKVPLIFKPEILILIDTNKNIIAIPGMGISEKVKIHPETTNILTLHLSKKQ
jgi:tRNA(Ile)-lysidine synthase